MYSNIKELFATKWYRAILTVGLISICSSYIPGLEKIRWWSSIKPSNSLYNATVKLSASTVESTISNLSVNIKKFINPDKTPLWTTLSQENFSCNDVYPIEDPKNILVPFLKKLQESKEGKRITRIIHYGDSLIAGDWVTGTLRDYFQRDFGDAGPGFILPMKAWKWYGHKGLRLQDPDNWKVYRITKPPIFDNKYGIGGVTFLNVTPDAEFSIRVKNDYSLRFPKETLIQIIAETSPQGGEATIYLDNQREAELSTKYEYADTTSFILSSSRDFEKITIKVNKGVVRLYGVVFEYGNKGIVYDSIGIQGAQFTHFLKISFDHWIKQLKLRLPDLIIFQYGTNESEAKDLNVSKYYSEIKKILSTLKSYLPDTACLVVAPMDRAIKNDEGRLTTKPIIKLIVETQRKASIESGCAFWNTFMAMGGEDSMVRWAMMKPRLASADYTHPTSAGAERIATMFYCSIKNLYNNAFKTTSSYQKSQKDSVNIK